MTTEERYINLVIDRMPRATPLRSQIAMELHSHIAERVQHGQPMDDVLRQLGDPDALAESYLAAVPLVSGSFWRRVAAKIIDVLALICVTAPIGWLVWRVAGPPFVGILVVIAAFGFCAYVVIAEYRAGQTLGKRFLGLRVVRESGARISLGQALTRQLPLLLNIFWIDALFVLFTEKNQRAFELLSKTRVVVAPEQAL